MLLQPHSVHPHTDEEVVVTAKPQVSEGLIWRQVNWPTAAKEGACTAAPTSLHYVALHCIALPSCSQTRCRLSLTSVALAHIASTLVCWA